MALWDTRRARIRHCDHHRSAFASLVPSSLHHPVPTESHRFALRCRRRALPVTQVTLMTQVPILRAFDALATCKVGTTRVKRSYTSGPPAALTSARMPTLIALGRRGHAATTRARSRSVGTGEMSSGRAFGEEGTEQGTAGCGGSRNSLSSLGFTPSGRKYSVIPCSVLTSVFVRTSYGEVSPLFAEPAFRKLKPRLTLG